MVTEYIYGHSVRASGCLVNYKAFRQLFLDQPGKQEVFDISSPINHRHDVNRIMVDAEDDPPWGHDEFAIGNDVIEFQFGNDAVPMRQVNEGCGLGPGECNNFTRRVRGIKGDIVDNVFR
jgi:hypothetical protein